MYLIVKKKWKHMCRGLTESHIDIARISSTQCILVRLSTGKKKIVKSTKKCQQVIFKRNFILLTADFLVKVLQARSTYNDVFQLLKKYLPTYSKNTFQKQNRNKDLPR